jgi:L-alanine-DL-glutamate epimerase-like enolase superfamily enzyme
MHLRYSRDGITSYGEGAPIVRYQESPEKAKQALDAILPMITAGDPRKFDTLLADTRKALGEGQHAAMAAVDIALCD